MVYTNINNNNKVHTCTIVARARLSLFGTDVIHCLRSSQIHIFNEQGTKKAGKTIAKNIAKGENMCIMDGDGTMAIDELCVWNENRRHKQTSAAICESFYLNFMESPARDLYIVQEIFVIFRCII